MAGFFDLAPRILKLARTIDDLLNVQENTNTSLKAIGDRLKALEDRMTHLEANQGNVITEARAAASAASTMVTGAVLAEAFTRLTRIEEAAKRLPPPGAPQIEGPS